MEQIETSSFLTLGEVLEIHNDQLARYGGASGIRDQKALESALAQPSLGFGDQLLHSTVFDQAAAYLYHIVKNHPFIDGNKRTATVSAVVFLEINGYELDEELDLPAEENKEVTILERAVVDTITGKMDKSALSAFLKMHSKPKQGRS